METINRLTRAGFILRLELGPAERFFVEVYVDNSTCIAFRFGNTFEDAAANCLIDVIEWQAQAIQDLKRELALTRSVLVERASVGPKWGGL